MNIGGELNQLIQKQCWSAITEQFTPDFLINTLGYKSAMQLAYDLFFNNFADGNIQEFAVNLLFSIHATCPTEWNNDWKNDVFLGQLCGLVWRYEERYECYRRAYEKLKNPPDSLLLLMAGCNSMPGQPSISDEESEQFLRMAMEKKVTYESALKMRGVCRDKGDKILEDYWNKKMHELEQAHIYTDVIVPDIFVSRQ